MARSPQFLTPEEKLHRRVTALEGAVRDLRVMIIALGWSILLIGIVSFFVPNI